MSCGGSEGNGHHCISNESNEVVKLRYALKGEHIGFTDGLDEGCELPTHSPGTKLGSISQMPFCLSLPNRFSHLRALPPLMLTLIKLITTTVFK